MSERKRQKTNKNIEILNTTMITKFEQFPNELILICFRYFDFYYLYKTFSCLNQRFIQLIFNQTKIYIDLDSIPNGDFLKFVFKLNHFLSTSLNYPISISTYNEHLFNLIIQDNLFQDKFSKLKSLTLSEMHGESIFNAIFDQRIKLYKSLQRLTLIDISETDEFGHDIERLFKQLISSKMKSLKYLNLTIKPYSCGCENNVQSRDNYVNLEFHDISREEKSFSNLETLIIGDIPNDDDDTSTKTKLSFCTLTEELLPCLPKLKNLIINSIYFNQNRHLQLFGTHQSTTKTNAVTMLNLKLIKIWTITECDNEDAERKNTKLLRNFFMKTKSSDAAVTIKTFYINNENVLE